MVPSLSSRFMPGIQGSAAPNGALQLRNECREACGTLDPEDKPRDDNYRFDFIGSSVVQSKVALVALLDGLLSTFLLGAALEIYAFAVWRVKLSDSAAGGAPIIDGTSST